MSSLSIFKRANDTSPVETMTVDEFLHSVKFHKWQKLIEPIRAEPDKIARGPLKEKLPGVTVSGVFSKRKEENLISHSGFICIDVDDYTDKSRIIEDKYTYSCFTSVSGNGFCIIVKINATKHKDSFRWLQKYYFENYGIVVDPAPSNVASLRYISYDPNLEINKSSKTALTLALPKKEKPSLPIILSDSQVGDYVREAVQRGLDLANTYEEYITLAFSLANGFGEAGRAYFHSLSSINEKYDFNHAERQFSIALKDKGHKKVTVGTFYFLLKQAGVDIKPENNKAVQIAAMGKKSKRSKEAVTQQLIEINGVNPNTAAALVEEVFSRGDISLKTISADPERLIESLSEWLLQSHPLRKNEITRKLESANEELSEERLNTIFLQARAAFNTPNVTFDLVNRIIRSDLTPIYNPFTDYIERNSHRNSAGNIEALCSSIHSSTPGGYAFTRKWLLGIIATLHGLTVRYNLTLIGPQFTGKTEFFRRLLPDSLKKYYGESHFDRGKDDEIMMCQKLIILDDEMGGKSKTDEKLMKELTSKDVFTLRRPYGHGNEDLKRLAILCGTSNDRAILSDRTGNTRILPIEITYIDFEAYNSVDKDELFMELYRAYQSGEEWQLNNEDFAQLNETGKEFETINFEFEIISRMFKKPTEAGLVEQMTATEIKNHIESFSKQTIKSIPHFGRELNKMFGRSIQEKRTGRRVYSVIKKLANEYDRNPNEPEIF